MKVHEYFSYFIEKIKKQNQQGKIHITYHDLDNDLGNVMSVHVNSYTSTLPKIFEIIKDYEVLGDRLKENGHLVSLTLKIEPKQIAFYNGYLQTVLISNNRQIEEMNFNVRKFIYNGSTFEFQPMSTCEIIQTIKSLSSPNAVYHRVGLAERSFWDSDFVDVDFETNIPLEYISQNEKIVEVFKYDIDGKQHWVLYVDDFICPSDKPKTLRKVH